MLMLKSTNAIMISVLDQRVLCLVDQVEMIRYLVQGQVVQEDLN